MLPGKVRTYRGRYVPAPIKKIKKEGRPGSKTNESDLISSRTSVIRSTWAFCINETGLALACHGTSGQQ